MRKLVISYPLFGPASLLYGACLLEQGRLPAAAEIIDRAKLAGLKPQENKLADSLIENLLALRAEENRQASPSAGRPASVKQTSAGQPSGASILERTRRPSKARMASRREVQDVLRHGDVPDQEPTRVITGKAPHEKLRLGLTVAGIFLIDLERVWTVKAPGAYHLEYGFSCMGYETAGALGVKMAAPEKEVYVFVGDGAFLMSHSNLVTSLQERQKVNILLFNNNGHQCIHNLQRSQGIDLYPG